MTLRFLHKLAGAGFVVLAADPARARIGIRRTVAWTAMPLAGAAAVGVMTLLCGRDWAPIAILAAVGQLVLMPPPPFLERQLMHLDEVLAGHAGVLGLALQLAVAAAALAGAAQRAC